MKRLPWHQNSGAVTFIFIFLLGEGAIYQHQHVCAPSLTTTILPSYFKKILATNNIVLTLFYPEYFIPHNTRGRGGGKSAPKLFLLLAGESDLDQNRLT